MSDSNNDKPILGLPAPGPQANPTVSVGDPNGVKMDHLGPIIVNENGTMSRIANWDQLTDGEKATSLRLIAKRNKERLARLAAAEAQQQQQ